MLAARKYSPPSIPSTIFPPASPPPSVFPRPATSARPALPSYPSTRRRKSSSTWDGLNRIDPHRKKPLEKTEDHMAEDQPATPPQPSRYQRVKDYLNQAAGDGHPSYQGYGRFWELPL